MRALTVGSCHGSCSNAAGQQTTRSIPDLHADTGLYRLTGMTGSSGKKLENRHVFAGAADVTSSVMTLKPASVHGPNEVTIATSVASRPRAIKMRPIRRLVVAGIERVPAAT